MWKELLTSSAAQWIFGISGTAILIAIAYYVIGRIKDEMDEEIPTPEENLVEFDRMRDEGHLENDEFQEVKKSLAPKIRRQMADGRQQDEC
ncbi:MAG: hypothetical protein FWC43_07365 [Planctomycetaceae bacterium]|nr:hypothetical protein [Planctomycetaceae bacterium]